MARWFFPWIVRLAVTPNQWTFLSLLLGFVGDGCIAAGGYRLGLVGAFFFQLFYLVDNWDGEVARAKGLSSRWGGWFDVAVDAVIQVALALCLAEGLQRRGAPPWVRQVGWFAALGLSLDYLVTMWAKARGFGPAVFGDPTRGQWVLSDSRMGQWVRSNLTNENFSLLVVLVLVLDWRTPFLFTLAIGSQVFWLFFLRQNRREFRDSYNLAQARR